MTNSPGAYHATENNRNTSHTTATSTPISATSRRQDTSSHYIMPADPHGCCDPAPTVLSGAGICFIVLGYTMFGAFTFMTLENSRDNVQLRPNQHQHQPSQSQPQQQQYQPNRVLSASNDKLRAQTVEKLWKITEDLNILYRDNWTRLAEQEILKFQDSLIRKYGNPNQLDRRHRWNFASSFLYSLTLITTIGYGNVTPQTPWGRVITILYALIGIPLMLLYLSTMGETLAKNFRRIYSRMCSVPSRRDEEDDERQDSRRKRLPPNTVSSNHIGTTGGSGGDFIDYYRYDFETITGATALPPISPSSANISFSNQKRVPILLSLSIVGLYVALGAYIYHKLEKWTLLEGSYFCFTSLGTIGFGELVPGGIEATKDVSVFVSSGYILIGMAIVAMCFQLLQDELAAIARNFRWWWWSSRKEFEDAANSNDSVLIVSPTHNS